MIRMPGKLPGLFCERWQENDDSMQNAEGRKKVAGERMKEERRIES
jgi:hypothetical protein